MDGSGLTRGTRWCQNYFSILSVLEVIHEKLFSPKTYFFPLVTSRTCNIRLTANLRAQIGSRDQELSFGYLKILLTSRVIDIIATFCENSPILRKFNILWPPVTSNLTWSKNDKSICYRTCRGLSKAVYRLSLSFFVFELSGGRVSARPRRAGRWLRLCQKAMCGLILNVASP